MFQQCFSRKSKNLCKSFVYNYLQRFLSTQTRGRTGMEVNPLVFETSASTDSAIWATRFLNCGAKIRLFSKPTILFLKKGEFFEKIRVDDGFVREKVVH